MSVHVMQDLSLIQPLEFVKLVVLIVSHVCLQLSVLHAVLDLILKIVSVLLVLDAQVIN